MPPELKSVAATDFNNAEGSAAAVRIIIGLFIIAIIIGTLFLVLSTESADLQLIFFANGLFSIMGLLLLLFMWDSIYQMLSHIANPGRKAPVIGTTMRQPVMLPKIRRPPPN